MNDEIKKQHLKALHKICYDAETYIVIDNNKIERFKRGYEIRDNTTGEMKAYRITLEIKEIPVSTGRMNLRV